MLKILYSPAFISQFERLDDTSRSHAYKKIDLFTKDPKHPSLRTHKLNGQLEGFLSFSVDYTLRIVFEYKDKNTVIFLKVGDHSVYR